MVTSSDSLERRADSRGQAVDVPTWAWVGHATALVTLVAFALAITALPNSGRGCTSDCVSYPFSGEEVAAQFPGDYLWLIPAMVLLALVVALFAAVHVTVPRGRSLPSLLALCLACMAAAILLLDYFVQLTVLPLSLEKQQLDGWSMLTQYNPNGVFLALEELGYLLLALALGVLSAAFTGRTRLERWIRAVLRICAIASGVALVLVSAIHGWDRQDSFEIPVISIVWLTLVVVGPLISRHLRSRPIA